MKIGSLIGSSSIALVLCACSQSEQQSRKQSVSESPAPTHQNKDSDGHPSKAISAIEIRLGACKASLGEYARPVDLQQCDWDTIAAAKKLVGRSKGNEAMDQLLPDLFEPLMYYIAGGDALAIRVVIAAKYSDFALKRAAILTGTDQTLPAATYTDKRIGELLDKVTKGQPDLTDGKTLAQEWAAVRDADCSAYAVPNCRVRMNSVFGSIIYETIMDADTKADES